MTNLSTLMPQWITGWRKWQWGSFMIKFLQASGNMLNKTASISLFAVISRSAIMNMIFELIGLLLVVGCAFFTTFS